MNEKILDTDRQLAELLIKRIELCREEAERRRAEGLPVYDRDEELATVEAAALSAGEYAEQARSLINVAIGLSKRCAQ